MPVQPQHRLTWRGPCSTVGGSSHSHESNWRRAKSAEAVDTLMDIDGAATARSDEHRLPMRFRTCTVPKRRTSRAETLPDRNRLAADKDFADASAMFDRLAALFPLAWAVYSAREHDLPIALCRQSRRTHSLCARS